MPVCLLLPMPWTCRRAHSPWGGSFGGCCYLSFCSYLGVVGPTCCCRLQSFDRSFRRFALMFVTCGIVDSPWRWQGACLMCRFYHVLTMTPSPFICLLMPPLLMSDKSAHHKCQGRSLLCPPQGLPDYVPNWHHVPPACASHTKTLLTLLGDSHNTPQDSATTAAGIPWMCLVLVPIAEPRPWLRVQGHDTAQCQPHQYHQAASPHNTLCKHHHRKHAHCPCDHANASM